MDDVDPITYSVIVNSLTEISSEIDDVVVRTARNIPVIIARDFSVGITDGSGDLVDTTQGLPIHLGSIDMTVKSVIEHVREINPGDVILTNDPYDMHNTHLPDFTMIHPVFDSHGETPLLYVLLRADQADVGAKDPVRSPVDTEEIYNEGLILPPVKVVDRGDERTDVIDVISKNSRVEIIQRGDLYSMINAVQKGADLASSLVEKHGAETVRGTLSHLLTSTEEKVEEYVRNLPDGTYHGESQTDATPTNDEPVHISVDVTIDGANVTFDFSGSDEQVSAPINNTLSITHAAVNAAWFMMLDLDIPFNAGCSNLIDVVAPEGLVVNPAFPSPVGYSTVDCYQETQEACLYALGELSPQNAPAGWSRWVRPLLSGTDPGSGQPYRGVITSVMGGSGAVWGRDGVNCLGPLAGGTLLPDDPEMFEALYPLHIHEMEIRQDSGGGGRWRGGAGLTVVVSPNDHRALFSVGGDFGQKAPPRGYLGGQSGDAVHVYKQTPDGTEEIPRSWTDVYLTPEDKYIQECGGGGGVGRPRERDPEKVLLDVKNGYVSGENARDEYGVIIDEETLELDYEATERTRGETQ